MMNGLGMGNSTRRHSNILGRNSEVYDVDNLTCSNEVRYFQRTDQDRVVDDFERLAYAKSGDLSNPGSILALPTLMVRYAGNVPKLRKKVRGGAYSGLVIDSDYSAVFVKWLAGNPSISLNNADIMLPECAKRYSSPAGIEAPNWVEWPYHVLHRIISHPMAEI